MPDQRSGATLKRNSKGLVFPPHVWLCSKWSRCLLTGWFHQIHMYVNILFWSKYFFSPFWVTLHLVSYSFPQHSTCFPQPRSCLRTQPWDSNGLLRPSGCASEWTLRHLYKFLRLQAWRSAYLPSPGTSNVRKLLWLLKLPLINLVPSASFLGLSLLSVEPVSDFTPKGPEVMNRHQQFHSWERERISI